MYAIYNYQAGATQANVVADLIKLITGETNKANLSADCVQANTTITSTVAAGWSVYDASAGTNYQVVRVLNQDAATYKYFGLEFSSTTVFKTYICESWNSGTHAATNAQSYITGVWNSTGGGYFYLYVTAKNIVIFPWTSGGYQLLHGIFEFSRDTIPSGYPCAALITNATYLGSGNAQSISFPRVKKTDAVGDATTNNAIAYGSPIVPAFSNVLGVTQTYRDASENIYLATYKLGAILTATYVHMGTGYDVLLTGNVAGSALDQISYGGTNYVLFLKTGSSNSTLLVPLA